ncbi:MAG: hypothetical protein KA885_08570 [Spirochaetes bacterium]|nr:hypothetical protein [Spirochaetota bacterium]
MYNDAIKIIFIIFLIFSCCSCSNETDPDYLPTFEGINADANTIFLSNEKDDNKHILYAVDTGENKIIYRYEFNNLKFYDMAYDNSFDFNPYIVFLNGKAIKLNTKTGKCDRFELGFSSDYVEIVGDRLWICPSGAGLEGVSKDYYVYEADNGKGEYVTLPEGLFNGKWTFIDNKYYFSLFMDIINSKIYNYTNNVIVGNNLFGKKYALYRLKGNYLEGILSESYIGEVYYINSFEPLDGQFLFSGGILSIIDVFEFGNLVYFLEIDRFSELYITMRDKSDGYKQIKQINFNDSGNYLTYCKNGYIWCVSEDNDGAYKVNMDDLSYEIIN